MTREDKLQARTEQPSGDIELTVDENGTAHAALPRRLKLGSVFVIGGLVVSGAAAAADLRNEVKNNSARIAKQQKQAKNIERMVTLLCLDKYPKERCLPEPDEAK